MGLNINAGVNGFFDIELRLDIAIKILYNKELVFWERFRLRGGVTAF